MLRLDGAAHHLHAWLKERLEQAALVSQRVFALGHGA